MKDKDPPVTRAQMEVMMRAHSLMLADVIAAFQEQLRLLDERVEILTTAIARQGEHIKKLIDVLNEKHSDDRADWWRRGNDD